MRSNRAMLLFSPPPTPNGPLHLGHLAGPFLAGDIAARAARARGQQVLHVCGLDAHQNYVPARAEKLGQPVQEMVEQFSGQIRDAYAAARIDYDLFVDPLADADFRDGVRGLLAELIQAKRVVVTETTLSACAGCGRILHHARVSGRCPGCGQGSGGGTCEGCGGFCTAADLIDAVSSCCQQPPIPVQQTIPVFRLEDYREQLERTWAQAVIPPRVRALIGQYQDRPLPDIPVAYPTDWGIRWQQDDTELRIDVWVELGLGMLYAVARHLDPAARTLEECVAAWGQAGEMWHTLGIDNAFYYGIMIPALLMAAGLPVGTLTGLVVNEFYRLDGLKFSTSRNHAIWADEFLAETDVGLVRAYLAWDRPDRDETDFRRSSLAAFAARYPLLGDSRPAPAPAGAPSAGSVDARLAAASLGRAERALELAGFDPALALRCVLEAAPADPDRASAVLSWITGTSPQPEGIS